MVPLLKSLIFSHLRDERGHGVHARARRVVHERAVLEVDPNLPLVHLDSFPFRVEKLLCFDNIPGNTSLVSQISSEQDILGSERSE